ncbi:MAG: helix-turn-helix domain-containing protein [Candidatus Bathyarchaeota archaeon]|nr:helix-turn-helix domain-containing protein [Candidatus Bathyarchaeota archaeon]
MSLKIDRRVIALLSESPMSMRELAEKIGLNEKQIYRVLTSLHKSKRIIHARDEDGVRRYKTA